MAKKNIANKPVDNLTILKYNTSEFVDESALEYSKSTLIRAIPGIDGMKGAQRKAIFTISKVQGEIKTISCAGKMISDGIYLHGDASACGTLQQLASPVVNNIPLLGKRGGFGTQAKHDPASPRYTYVKRNTATDKLLLVDSDIVPMQDNYDGSTKEPKFFLPIIPISLLGANGIAVGYSSSIAPRKLEDIIQNCINYIDGNEQYEMVPDYSSYGSNTNVESLGDGKFKVYGRIEILDSSTVKVVGLPPYTSLEKFIEKLIKMDEDGLIRDYDNDSTDIVDVTIKLPRCTAN